jgi:hypothetical protein
MFTKYSVFRLLVALFIILMISSTASASPLKAPNGTGFTYQGKLIDGGVPANGAYDLQFKLYDALSGGAQVGSTLTQSSVTVTNGLFTVQLDFGNVFNGTALYLEIGVALGGSGGPYTTLTPRQPLSPTPYALFASNTSLFNGLNAASFALASHTHWGQTWTGTGTGLTLSGGSTGISGSGTSIGVHGSSIGTFGVGVSGTGSVSGTGVSGTGGTGVYGSGSTGVYGTGTGTNSTGISGTGSTGVSGIGSNYGVYGDGVATNSTGVFGMTAYLNSYGVSGTNTSGSGTGVYGTGNTGVSGNGTSIGVYGNSSSNYGVYGDGSIGVRGSGTTYGVYGQVDLTAGTGVRGYASATSGTTYGMYGQSDSIAGKGVYGEASATSGNTSGVYGQVDSTAGKGVYGYAIATSGTTSGVYGQVDSTDGSGVRGYASATSGSPYGVYGQSASTLGGAGVYGLGFIGVAGNGTGTNSTGVSGISGSGGTGIYGHGGAYAGYFAGNVEVVGDVNVYGAFYVHGSPKSAVVDTKDYGTRTLYAVESPENWFQDFGTGQLTNGSAIITIDPVFAETVNLATDYHVFFTPMGDCALYITDKTPTSFTVKALGGQTCSIAFDYNIVAKRLGYETLRLAVADTSSPAAGTPNK